MAVCLGGSSWVVVGIRKERERNLIKIMRIKKLFQRTTFTRYSEGIRTDQTQMVLLVHPDQERLVVVVVDTSADRPVSASVSGLQETIALLEQEVVIDQLLLGLLVHALCEERERERRKINILFFRPASV